MSFRLPAMVSRTVRDVMICVWLSIVALSTSGDVALSFSTSSTASFCGSK
ncbi:hypothetical protein [Peteryoungia algae]|uniref:Uncharacterized protein n=1 Tax=Peteryoungia algae TaxID=2919917 RepID=A0ABT0D020_9HYPH|nr:hypothetical protein [Rhizobium sp. SSM4.3]MCJ8238725.1 hypothetical protein [Rhizobium sp. SSM4.3]